MDNLVKEKTKNTLGVNFDASTGILELNGSSLPENASEFFNPLIEWLQQFMLEVTGKITLNFRLDYLNSSSIKFISDLLDKVEMYNKSGGDVEVNWYYDENDEDIQEMGEDLKEDVSVPFNIIMK
jgi:Ran GTPase-activating protein (RanGAP) involved in mRNA processing and transport